MNTGTRLTCRACDATPDPQRDAVSRNAVAYTCSHCLMRGSGEGHQDRRSDTRQGVDSRIGPSAVSAARSDAGLASEMRDADSQPEKPLAEAQRRLGKRGPKPGTSRQARYRRRHPEYVQRERARLERLRSRSGNGARTGVRAAAPLRGGYHPEQRQRRP